MLIDAHAHLDEYEDSLIDDVIEEVERLGILTLSVSVDVPSYRRIEAISARAPQIVPAFGIHPSEATRYVDSLGEIEEFVARSPLLGEIGLDHRFVTDSSDYGAQRTVFDRFLAWATDQEKIVNVHCVGAEQETADLLREHRIARAIIHWYSGPLDVLSQMVDCGYLFTVGVEVRHSPHVRDVARVIPSAQLLTETDNPGGQRWLTGESGHPSVITDVVARLAEVRGVPRPALVDSVQRNLAEIMGGDTHLAPWLALLDEGGSP